MRTFRPARICETTVSCSGRNASYPNFSFKILRASSRLAAGMCGDVEAAFGPF